MSAVVIFERLIERSAQIILMPHGCMIYMYPTIYVCHKTKLTSGLIVIRFTECQRHSVHATVLLLHHNTRSNGLGVTRRYVLMMRAYRLR